MKKNVLVVLPLRPGQKELLEKAGEGCRFLFSSPETVTDEQIAEAEVLIGNLPAARIAASPRLELMQLYTAGADPYLVPGALDPRTRLCNATGAYGKAVSEHAFALTLMLLKKLNLYRDNQKKSLWRDQGTVSTLSGATVLVIGLGDIGLSYARLVKAMGARVIGVKRRPGACPEGVDELCGTDSLNELLPRADLVATFLPGNGSTYHLYDEDRFARMKPGAFFINCGRGGAVDGDALYRALTEGPLAAAAVDVTEPEPLPADSPLWQLDNLMITPHVAGWLHLPEILDRVVEIAAENLSAFLAGGELKNQVDFETGYRKG